MTLNQCIGCKAAIPTAQLLCKRCEDILKTISGLPENCVVGPYHQHRCPECDDKKEEPTLAALPEVVSDGRIGKHQNGLICQKWLAPETIATLSVQLGGQTL